MRKVYLMLLVAILVCQPAFALENGQSPYPAGVMATQIASLPPIPGVFMLQQSNYRSSSGLFDGRGDRLPVPFHSSAYSQTTRLLATYPFHVLGANVSSQLVFPYVNLSANIAGAKTDQSGLANITITPVILSWNLLGDSLHLAAGMDLMPKSGDYDPTGVSIATGYSSYSPVFGIRYERPDDGPIVALSNRFLLNSTNSVTGYDSGDVYIAEFHAGWKFGDWTAGLVGGYEDQYTDDTANGHAVAPGGNRYKSLAYGPSIQYQGEIYHFPVLINLNYQRGVLAENTSMSDNIYLNIGVPLYVPSMMH